MPHDERRDEVGDLARALARMQEELRRQEAARRAFVSTASHELRTPLTMLQGTMELLEEDIRSGQIDELDALRQVDTARARAGPPVGAVGRAARPLAARRRRAAALRAGRAGRDRPRRRGGVRAARARALHHGRRDPARGVVLGPRRPGRGRARRADPARQRAALRPARRAGVGRGALGAAARRAITVADQGAGIPPEERDRIFERFHRGGAAASSGGFGLGLAIGRELARRMGGELEVDGDGSRRHALRAHAAHRALARGPAARRARPRQRLR